MNFKETTEESRLAWETNADYWDEKMGDASNYFHCTIVRPHTEELLSIQPGDLVLDAACGTGNFSQRIAEQGAQVVAFDYSEKMIAHAKRRRSSVLDRVSFQICDATDKEQLLHLKQSKLFDKAVANMAIMDIADITPLFQAVYQLLRPGGIFVFSMHHPCFIRPEGQYFTSCVYKGDAILGQPVEQNYYHRSLQDLFGLLFRTGFVMDGFYEVPDKEAEYPVIFITRLQKPNS